MFARLKDWDDHASWQEFHDTYWRLIHNFALKQGVADHEARDIVHGVLVPVDVRRRPVATEANGW